ncbi:acid phosphatase [Erythrobacteraceae bacterium CFH 75059]|uniref:HAD family acid phosphatase n=1 Tax=Qipengyuania thermophila TaxID=2509361 RepID=UPI0010208AB2|nr:HAD family acid phosphatase [Qipengyuania thermophila]TCD06891.1 acid phosphatase [Erythrobacteraceae bacterium CFH 75059]
MRVLVALAAALALGGCATGAVLADQVVAPALDRALQTRSHVADGPVLTLPPVTDGVQRSAEATADARPVPLGTRWLYSSAEAAAVSLQAFRQLGDYVRARQAAQPAASVLLGLPGRPDGLGTESCLLPGGGRKPPAVIFDGDETLVLNRGHEYWRATSGQPFDPAVWAEWERTGNPQLAAVPGAVAAVRALREAGITPIINTNRALETAADTVRGFAQLGFGDYIVGETIFLRGMDAAGSDKDPRRARIAARYCVLAQVGDNLGDFADLFNERELGAQERRRIAQRGEVAQLWGNGWFVLPNPVYGAFDRGGIADVFPPDARWQPQTTRSAPDIMSRGN